ncbi:hypothetical protein E2C01_082449 [Portunus trituberculatus]|uniref:Uncharacterized protein n=1 Tax=Portunus trituberculatus TaxID=210409 RepID=A0A5B7IZA4_PORTR|nr:hypothetical protein [Portunus trituberculatus]
MDVNARSYRWSESRSKVCHMCDSGEDETVEHVMLECVKYARDRYEMIQVVLTELGHDRNERVEKTGREWMVVLLGLSKETNERIIEAVKEFLERMWRARCTDGAADPKARLRSDPESPVVSRSRSRSCP